GGGKKSYIRGGGHQGALKVFLVFFFFLSPTELTQKAKEGAFFFPNYPPFYRNRHNEASTLPVSTARSSGVRRIFRYSPLRRPRPCRRGWPRSRRGSGRRSDGHSHPTAWRVRRPSGSD